MSARKKIVLFGWLLLVALSIAGCAAATPQTIEVTRVVEGEPQTVVVTAAPFAAEAPAEAADAELPGPGGLNASPFRANRLIIKNGEIALQVKDVNLAVDQVTDIAVNSAGYIVSSRTWVQDGFTYASMQIGVPVDQFESVQRRLRALAVNVISDTASGQDVSDEFVDLESRLTNLEATAARIREFLAQAKDVKEALSVNQELSAIEAEIEQVKGRMNYLEDRSAFSTMLVNLEPQRPTPTPTAVVWMPEKTFEQASNTLGGVARGIGDLAIWLGVVGLPIGLPLLIVAVVVSRLRSRAQTKQPKPPTE
jgi:hypothetical protein